MRMRGKNLLLKLDPEAPDFTNPDRPAKLLIHGDGMKIAAPLVHDREKLLNLLGGLELCFEANIIVAWNIKPLFSFFKAITGKNLDLGRIWDLKVIEHFHAVEEAPPKTVEEALGRLSRLPIESFAPIYDKIYTPFIKTILPQMETTGLAHQKKKKVVYPYFELEDSANGRLKCRGAWKRSYLPHTMDKDDKANLLPVDYDDVFMYFDFKAFEVSVLQWVSGDTKLEYILGSGDAYPQIWRATTSLEPDQHSKERAKTLFLSVLFGSGAKSVAEKFGTDEKTGRELINRLKQTFPTAFQWIEQLELDEGNYSTDCFGRIRKFEIGKDYLVRNFQIQAPASTICFKKTIDLYEKTKDFAKLSFHVHDGMVILVNKGEVRKAANIGTKVLESDDDMFPGLKLQVSCKWGRRLDQLENI